MVRGAGIMTYNIYSTMPSFWLEGTLDFRFLKSDMRTGHFFNDKVPISHGRFSFKEGKVKFKSGSDTCREGVTSMFYDLLRAIRVSGRLKDIKYKQEKYLRRKWRPSVVKLCFHTDMSERAMERVTKLADVLVANNFVLLFSGSKRSPIAGRAGDFTFKGSGDYHKYSYDVLSELSIFHPAMISFSLGALRTAYAIRLARHSDAFLTFVDEDRVQKAINENDVRLARRNFENIKPFLQQLRVDGHSYDNYSPLTSPNLPIFEKVLKKGGAKGTIGLSLHHGWGLRAKHGRNSSGFFDTYRSGRMRDRTKNGK